MVKRKLWIERLGQIAVIFRYAVHHSTETWQHSKRLRIAMVENVELCAFRRQANVIMIMCGILWSRLILFTTAIGISTCWSNGMNENRPYIIHQGMQWSDKLPHYTYNTFFSKMAENVMMSWRHVVIISHHCSDQCREFLPSETQMIDNVRVDEYSNESLKLFAKFNFSINIYITIRSLRYIYDLRWRSGCWISQLESHLIAIAFMAAYFHRSFDLIEFGESAHMHICEVSCSTFWFSLIIPIMYVLSIA